MKLIILVLLITFIISLCNCNELAYSDPITFETILSSFPFDQLKTVKWRDGKVDFGQPSTQLKPTILIGTNIPMNTDFFNDDKLIDFFGENSSEATFMSHFNCKNSGEPSCQEYSFSNPQDEFCIVLASIDGFDYVTLETDSNNLWNTTAEGSFSTDFQSCNQIHTKQETEKYQLGCFEEVCTNPNYIILKSVNQFTNLKICYNSFSTSENILYSFGHCYDPNDEVVTVAPKISAFSVSGTAFLDKNGNGIYDNGIDMPMANVPVTITTSLGQPARDLNGNILTDIKTNNQGYYSIQQLGRSSYYVSFGFDSSIYASTTKSSDLTNISTSKINPNFASSNFILSTIAPGVVDSALTIITTDKILPGINGGVFLK